VRRALSLQGDALELRNSVNSLLEQLPAVDPRALHALGERLYGVEAAPLAAFIDTVNGWLRGRLDIAAKGDGRLAAVAEAWEKVNAAARAAEEYNLDRKPLVFNVFGWLAEAVRR
jgi:DNA polymerase-3 subunit delta'